MELGVLTAEDVRKISALTQEQPAQRNVVTAAVKALTRPVVMQKTLIALAESKLPSRMGISFTRVTVSCLKCLEPKGGFGDAEMFEKNNKLTIGVQFGETVLQPLSSLLS